MSEKLFFPNAFRLGVHQENVFYLANMVSTWPAKLPVPPNCGKVLEIHGRIGGFEEPFTMAEAEMMAIHACGRDDNRAEAAKVDDT